jgi:hypothetical protein
MATEGVKTPLMAQRRAFFKQALVTCAYVAPIVMSFSAQDLVRAASGKEPKEPKEPREPRV